MEVLKIKIYQPQAHYRVPFTYQRRHTYPIPPYSTVKGLLCNLLGVRRGIEEIEYNSNDEDLKTLNNLKKLKMSICGNFEAKTSEYTWFRNLSKKSHLDRFGYLENRKVSGHIEHPGGQIPVTIDILNDIRITIYLHHEEKHFMEKIKSSLEETTMRLYPLHLGRAEDLFTIEDIGFTNLSIEDIEGNYKNFFWIPEKTYTVQDCIFNFSKVGGILYRLPTFYKIVNGVRSFDYIKVKLNDGDIGGIRIFFDREEKLPVFFLNLNS